MKTYPMYINLRVKNALASRTFFEGLGFKIEEDYSFDTSTAVRIHDGVVLMLLEPEQYTGFDDRSAIQPREIQGGIFSLAVTSKDEVDLMLAKALSLGGEDTGKKQQYSKMYVQSFYDLDGYYWELAWMADDFDPSDM
ncbi:MAG: VOC family protein [Erysipelotrichaceae bacterium]